MMRRSNSKVGIRNIQDSGPGFRGDSVAANVQGGPSPICRWPKCHPDMTGRKIIDDALKDGFGTS
jgi:hypothetical protein